MPTFLVYNNKEVYGMGKINHSQLYREFDQTNWADEYDVIEAIEKNGLFLCKASESLRNNKVIVTKALVNFPMAFKYVGNSLVNDKDLALLAVKGDWWSYVFLGDEIQKDKDIIDVIFPKFLTYFKIDTIYEDDDRFDVLCNKFLIKDLKLMEQKGG